MNIISNPPRENWEEILARPRINLAEIRTLVSAVLEAVKKEGDKALRDLTKQFDRVDVDNFMEPMLEMLNSTTRNWIN